MAYSRLVTPADGVTTVYAVNFPLGYLSIADVKGYVTGEVSETGEQLYRTLTWLTTGTVDIGLPGAVGSDVVIERTVDKTDLVHNFVDGDILTEQSMDESFMQSMMAVHEVLDGRFSALGAHLDMNGFRVQNLGDPVNDGDAVSLSWFRENSGTINLDAAQAAQAAAASAASAANSSSSAAVKAATATAAETVSVAARDVALESRDVAVAAKDATLAALDQANLGPATTEAVGVSRQATIDEAVSGISATEPRPYVTPEGLAAKTATTERAGLAELATNAETVAGTDAGRIVTPAGLAAALAALDQANLGPATTEAAGVSRQATIAEAESGVSTTPAALPHVTPEGLAAAITALASVPTVDKWSTRIIGEPFVIWDHLTGAEVPPTAAGGPRFIKLTASDTYNTGLLSNETVSGTAPLITATAVVSLSNSPLYGRTVQLVNTERRFLRAGQSGYLQDDALQGHFHNLYFYKYEYQPSSGSGSYTDNFSGGATNSVITGRVKEPITDGTNGAPRTANETRSRNIGATAYMRIF